MTRGHVVELVATSARPFTFTWYGDGDPPTAGDYLASVRRRDGLLTGSLWQIATDRPVATRDGSQRRQYTVVRLGPYAWVGVPKEARIQRFVWNAR